MTKAAGRCTRGLRRPKLPLRAGRRDGFGPGPCRGPGRAVLSSRRSHAALPLAPRPRRRVTNRLSSAAGTVGSSTRDRAVRRACARPARTGRRPLLARQPRVRLTQAPRRWDGATRARAGRRRRAPTEPGGGGCTTGPDSTPGPLPFRITKPARRRPPCHAHRLIGEGSPHEGDQRGTGLIEQAAPDRSVPSPIVGPQLSPLQLPVVCRSSGQPLVLSPKAEPKRPSVHRADPDSVIPSLPGLRDNEHA